MSPYTALLECPTAQPGPAHVPHLGHRDRLYDRHDATRALALLLAHARRPLHDADGPIPDELVVRGALAVLLGYPRRTA